MSFKKRDRVFAILLSLCLVSIAAAGLIDYKGRSVIETPTGAGGIALKGNEVLNADRVGTFETQSGPPDVNDDLNSVPAAWPNSVWRDTDDNRLYWCLSNSDGAAAWVRLITSTAAGVVDFAATTANTDLYLNFIGTTNSGELVWREDENRFWITNAGFTLRSDTNVLVVGTANNLNTTNPGIVLDRIIDLTGENYHGFSDESSVHCKLNGDAGNSYDCKVNIGNGESNDYDHYSGYQALPKYYSTGTITRLIGFQAALENAGTGTITTLAGYEARDGINSGGGTVDNCYGFWVRATQTVGSVKNLAFYNAGTAESAFMGMVGVNKLDPEDWLDVDGAITVSDTDNTGFFRKTSFVNHSFTGIGGAFTPITNTTAFASLANSTTTGGLLLAAFRETDGTAFNLQSYLDTTDAIAVGTNAILFSAFKSDGANGRAALGAGAILTLRDGTTERFRFMADGTLTLEIGVLSLKETTTPTANTNYGKVYTKSDNKLYFQDGAGNEHEISLVP